MLLGVLMGVVLGAAQAGGLRRNVRHPSRWIWVSALAWAPAMAIIFTGATLPNSTWPVRATLLLATLTGATAGATMGLVSGLCWSAMQAPSWSQAFMTGLLKSPAGRIFDGSLAVLHLRRRVSGRIIELPVQYAAQGTSLVVVPGRARSKRWWRNLGQPGPVEVFIRGKWRAGQAKLLRSGQGGYEAAVRAYQARWPSTPAGNPRFSVIVQIDLGQSAR